MTTRRFTPSAEQKAAIRWMDDHKYDNSGFLERPDIVAASKVSDADYDRLILFLKTARAVEVQRVDDGIYASLIRVGVEISEIIHQLDNPPPKDYWEDATKWFRSKPWSLPIIAAFILLPAIYQWLEIVWKIYQAIWWFGVPSTFSFPSFL